MHTHSLDHWRHSHQFLGRHHDRNERRTWLGVGLTAVMMVAEIIGGMIYGSMALVADGWHMSTHAGALAIAALSYRFATPSRDRPALCLRNRQGRRIGGIYQRHPSGADHA